MKDEMVCTVTRQVGALVCTGQALRREAEKNGICHLTVIVAAFIADGTDKGKLIVHNRRDKQRAKRLPCPLRSYNLFGGHCNPPERGDLFGKVIPEEFLLENALRELSEEMLYRTTPDDPEAVACEDRSAQPPATIYAKPFPVTPDELIPIGCTSYDRGDDRELSYLYALPVKSFSASSVIAADDCINEDGSRTILALPVSFKTESELFALHHAKDNDTEICSAVTRLWDKENEDVYHLLMNYL